MGNHTSTTVAESSEVEMAESVNHETSTGFHVFEIHMASVATTSTILIFLGCWCLCAAVILAKCRPALGRLWWRATRGNRKARRKTARQNKRRAENFELCSLTYQQRKSGSRWTSPRLPRPDSPCETCKVDIEKGISNDLPNTLDCGKSDYSI